MRRFYLPIVLTLLALGLSSPVFADGLPKLEEGYHYYCVGERANKFLKSPNAILVLKLREEDIDKDPRTKPICVRDRMDLHFILERFVKKKDQVFRNAWLLFYAPIEVAGEAITVRLVPRGGGGAIKKKARMIPFKRQNGCAALRKSPMQMASIMRSKGKVSHVIYQEMKLQPMVFSMIVIIMSKLSALPARQHARQHFFIGDGLLVRVFLGA